ncbi:MAG: MBL fold metallo-hydrolase [Bradymonadaceae bacterium]|nr:MBL fold metallo-hydrolase [Lujinxingiaceae bacterium]
MTIISSKSLQTTRETWGSAVQLTADLWRIRLSNTRGALLVNTYVYSTDGYVAVIDPGWPWTLDRLEEALRDLKLATSLAQVDKWLYTHSHIDHMGAAVLLHKRSKAPHVVWPWVAHELDSWHSFQDRINDWRPWAESAFAEPMRSELAALDEKRRRDWPMATMISAFGEGQIENLEWTDVGQTIAIGDLRLEVLDARGHDPYHIAFWEPERRWLFSGDVVLATPTPIGRAMLDDITLYEQSLARLGALDTALLLPGHGMHHSEDIPRAFSRAQDHLDHYRQGALRALYESGLEPLDLYTLSVSMTAERQPLVPEARWWVHLALVDSHLQKLVAEGLVERVEGPRYQLR